MIAHAWSRAGDFEIVENGGDFNELYCFKKISLSGRCNENDTLCETVEFYKLFTFASEIGSYEKAG